MIYVLYEVNAGVTCNLARFDYRTFIESAEQQKPKSIPKNSMILHLDGESFSDASGLQPDAVSNDVRLTSEASGFGGCCEFNGNSGDTSYIDILPTAGLRANLNDFTYSIRFKLNSTEGKTSNQQILFWYGAVGTGLPQVWCRTRGTDLQCNIASGGVETTLTAKDVISPGVWHHAVVVRDGTEHYLYLDGNRCRRCRCRA